jgi:hypothetical protein
MDPSEAMFSEKLTLRMDKITCINKKIKGSQTWELGLARRSNLLTDQIVIKSNCMCSLARGGGGFSGDTTKKG